MASEKRLNLYLEELYTKSPAMERCLKLATMAASSTVPVLVLGETGTGKTLLAQAIHNSSGRRGRRFVSFNASAMSDTLLESQLFGHEKGAFTGAQKATKGKFELADGGTLFLDEIADMSSLAQSKILRAVEYGEFERLGSEQVLHATVRIIAATNCSLRERIRARRFREDLYHRLNGLTLLIPALRDRPEDLPGLIASEIQNAAAEMGKTITEIDPAAMDLLLTHSWPGNLRELHHAIRTIILFAEGSEILPEHIRFDEDLPDTLLGQSIENVPAASVADSSNPPTALADGTPAVPGLDGDLSLESAVERHIRHVYALADRNQTRTAKRLGISRATLIRRLRKLGL